MDRFPMAFPIITQFMERHVMNEQLTVTVFRFLDELVYGIDYYCHLLLSVIPLTFVLD